MASNSEWELVDKEDEEDRPILGVFIPSVGFLPFGKQEDSSDLAVVVPTPSSTVVSSSAGLVLSRGPWSTYHVIDTLSSGSHHHHHLPRPSLPHRPDAPSVVIRVGPTRAGSFAVVCAIGGGGADADADGLYAFDAFDSLSGRWSLSAAGERFAVGRIDPDSGVAAAGSAYWRTFPPTPMVVGYDPSSGRVRILPPPPSAWASKWQLGSTRGCGRLCSVVLTDTNKAVGYKMEASSDRWGIVGSVQLAGLASAEPVRFEWSGMAMEVVLLLEGKLVVVDLEAGEVVSIKEVPPLPAPPAIAAKKMVPCVGKIFKFSDEEYVKVDDAA